MEAKAKKSNKLCIAIPARVQSTRLPNKIALDLAGRPMAIRTFDSAQNLCNRINESVLLDIEAEVWLVVDSRETADLFDGYGANIIIQPDGNSGTDRVIKCVKPDEFDAVMVWQADWPLINPNHLMALIEYSFNQWRRQAGIWTLAITKPTSMDSSLINNPNYVKVVIGRGDRVMYFSRSPVPYGITGRRKTCNIHIGVYLISAIEDVRKINLMPPEPVASMEDLEQLKYLAYGVPIWCLTNNTGTCNGIDTNADYQYYNEIYSKMVNDNDAYD